MDPWSTLVEPLISYEFMRTGLVAAVVVGVVSSVLSCLLVVRRQALLGDAISHAALLGVVLGYLVAEQAGVLWGAMVVGTVAGMAITFVERTTSTTTEVAMGIVFTFAFALGLAIISVARPRGIDIFHILFGNVLGVGQDQLVLTTVSGGIVVAGVVIGFRAFHIWSFDREVARALGVPVRAIDYVFTALLSAAIVASLEAVGLILVVAMLITPGATASLLADRLSSMMWVAAAVGVVASITGLYGSYYFDVASGPAIVIVTTFLFALTLVFAPRRGALARAVIRRRVAQRVDRAPAIPGRVD
jgi:ABC-type Mn2+/Zn2+ transport system permease subunit